MKRKSESGSEHPLVLAGNIRTFAPPKIRPSLSGIGHVRYVRYDDYLYNMPAEAQSIYYYMKTFADCEFYEELEGYEIGKISFSCGMKPRTTIWHFDKPSDYKFLMWNYPNGFLISDEKGNQNPTNVQLIKDCCFFDGTLWHKSVDETNKHLFLRIGYKPCR